jgi:hypothetical protein
LTIWWRMAEVTATWCGLSALAGPRVLRQTRQPSEFHRREQANPRFPRRHHLSAVERLGDSRCEPDAAEHSCTQVPPNPGLRQSHKSSARVDMSEASKAKPEALAKSPLLAKEARPRSNLSLPSEKSSLKPRHYRIFVGILTYGVQFRCPSLAPVSGHILTSVYRT